MKSLLKALMITSVMIVLTSCAPLPDSVDINPVLNPIAPANVGQGKIVAVQIETAPCYLPPGSYLDPVAHMCFGDAIAPAVHDAVFKGLLYNGFRPIDYRLRPYASRKLIVKIIALNYHQVPVFYYSDATVNSQIQVFATNSHYTYANSRNWAYSYRYSVERDKSYVVTPLPVQTEDNINVALSDNINQVINDRNLLTMLAK